MGRHGGHRPGAGRKRRVSEDDRHRIAELCEFYWYQAWDKNTDNAAFEQATSKEMKKIQKEVREKLIHGGPAALRFPGSKVSNDSLPGIASADPEQNAKFQARRGMSFTKWYQEQREEFLFAQEEHRERRCNARPEQPLRGPRPWGLKEEIIRRVAEEKSQELAIEITERFVKTCWDDYRKREREIAGS